MLAVPITFPIAYLCTMLTQKLGPTTEKERHLILDVLRGLALKLIFLWTLVFSLPASLLYAWSVVEGHPWGLTVHSLLYAVSVIPMSFSYIAAVWLM